MSFEVGDRVRASSKHSDLAIEGEVMYSDLPGASVKPDGHECGIFLHNVDFTFEVVQPPIVFGPGAVVKWPNGGLSVRGQDAWFNRQGEEHISDDDDFAIFVNNGNVELLTPGVVS